MEKYLDGRTHPGESLVWDDEDDSKELACKGK